MSSVTLRPETKADREFLCALYASTRTEELAPVPWPEESKQAFLRSQFEAQSVHYAAYYADAEFSIIERDGAPIGRLYVYAKDPTDVRIVDIALVPEARGCGIGTELLGQVISDAAAAGKSVSIHVERFNPAMRLYQRLGFEHVHADGVYFLLRWQGQGQASGHGRQASVEAFPGPRPDARSPLPDARSRSPQPVL